MGHSTPFLSASHYEHNPSFFQSFLDPYMKYGSGYYTNEDSLDEAAQRMLDRSIDLAALPDCPRVLDVGSGWGASFRRLRERLPMLRYEHVNPSSAQRAHIEGVLGNADMTYPCLVEDAELPSQHYHAIFLSDSICHVRDRTSVLRKLRGSLAEGGKIVIQDTFFIDDEEYAAHRDAPTTAFVQKDIFGFAHIPSFETFVHEISSAGLRAIFVEDISQHYVRTINGWIGRLSRVAPEDNPLRDPCIRYLSRALPGLGYTLSQMTIVLVCHEPSRRRRAMQSRSLHPSE